MQTLLEFMNRDRLKKYKPYKYFPKNKEELKNTINKLVKERGLEADLNDIDTSEIENMSYLFDYDKLRDFSGDISRWDVSKVEDMSWMFAVSEFNGDISKWKVDNVIDMTGMFWEAENFDQNLDEWNINSRCNLTSIFYDCPLETHPPKWYKKYVKK